jgi:hypothetical protein
VMPCHPGQGLQCLGTVVGWADGLLNLLVREPDSEALVGALLAGDRVTQVRRTILCSPPPR